MKRKALICLFLTCAGASPAPGQGVGPGVAGFGFTLAVTQYQVRDAVLNPIRHSGTSVSVELFHRGGGEDTRRRFGLSFMVNPLGDRYTSGRSSTLVHLAVDVRLERKVAEVAEGTSVILGGSVGWSTHFQFHEQWDQQHVYWLTATEAGLAAAIERSWGDGRSIRLDAGMPILALVSRPPERFDYREVNHGLGWMLGEINGRTRLATPAEHLALRGGITYSAVRDGRLRHALFWRTEYVRNTAATSRDLHILTHSLGASLSWPF